MSPPSVEASHFDPSKQKIPGLHLITTLFDLVVYAQVCCIISRYCNNKPLLFQSFRVVIVKRHLPNLRTTELMAKPHHWLWIG